MNLKKILNSKYPDLSEEEKRQARLVIAIILSIFVFILPWILSFIFLGEKLISEFKREALVGLLATIAVYIKIAAVLSGWVKKGPQRREGDFPAKEEGRTGKTE